MVWEIVFMMLILKIPIVYLCVVIWWAIREEPTPPDLAGVAVVADTPPADGSPTRRWTGRRRSPSPHPFGRAGSASPLPRRRGVRV